MTDTLTLAIRKATPLCVMVILMIGCSSQQRYTQPTQYMAATSEGGLGYSSVQLSPDQHRVMYTASNVTDAATVHFYTVRRAAEIAEEANFTGFYILDGNAEITVTQDNPLDEIAINQSVPPEQQCSMTGCKPVAQVFPTADEQTRYRSASKGVVHYSLVIQLGSEGAFEQADIEYFDVEKVLNAESMASLRQSHTH